jgi:cold shock CspA family protein
MPSGTVKNYLSEKAYGFLTPDDRRRDLFFHVRNYPFGAIPQPGQRVTYDIAPDNSGRPQAVNIQLSSLPAPL